MSRARLAVIAVWPNDAGSELDGPFCLDLGLYRPASCVPTSLRYERRAACSKSHSSVDIDSILLVRLFHAGLGKDGSCIKGIERELGNPGLQIIVLSADSNATSGVRASFTTYSKPQCRHYARGTASLQSRSDQPNIYVVLLYRSFGRPLFPPKMCLEHCDL